MPKIVCAKAKREQTKGRAETVAERITHCMSYAFRMSLFENNKQRKSRTKYTIGSEQEAVPTIYNNNYIVSARAQIHEEREYEAIHVLHSFAEPRRNSIERELRGETWKRTNSFGIYDILD